MVENKVKERRTELGMTQEQLAQKSSVGRSTISEIESGEHIPSVEVALLLAAALGKTVDDLFWID